MALFVLFSTLLVASATPTGFDKALLTRRSVSLDGLCGAYNGSATCAGSAFGNCCSQFGYCGSQPVYCGAGCQTGYGTCGVDTTLKWSNLGCFSDSTNARTLNAAINVAGNTVEKCQAACAAAGYTMAGMEFGTQCFCGMGFNNKNAAPVDPSQCNAPCPGDASEICGGSNALNLYTVKPVWQSMGCYSDSTNARTLTASINIAGNTVEKCQAACQANGYRYAGMEFGSQCFCGNSIGNGGAPVSSCAMPCPGDSTEVCGGSNALSLYYLYQ